MTKSKGWKATIIGLVLASAAVTTACGTVGGAAVGAGSGAAIGAGTGYGAGKGALIGTGVGAAAGAVYDIIKKQMKPRRRHEDMDAARRGAHRAAAPVERHGARASDEPADHETAQSGGNTPEMVSGQVVKIDRGQGKVTIREGNGRIHEFQASADTLKDLKEGDRIEARLRR